MSSSSLSDSQTKLQRILADLKHLDLTGSVEYTTPKWPVARGGFGEVYRGHYKRSDGSQTGVAIKCLTIYLDGRHDTAKIFRREVRAWSMMNHRNVLPLLGYTLEGTGDPSLVSPLLISVWMDNGHVLDFVKRNPGCNIARLALGMADGLAYLHEKEVVHSDFKSGNVLVSNAQEALICDFGLSQVSLDIQSSAGTTVTSKVQGTTRWLAYELLVDAETYPKATKESDTWAFGMTVYEIMTSGHPYAHIQIEAQVLISIMSQKLPSPPTALERGYKKHLWDICTACWNFDPGQRPTMEDVSRQVKGIRESADPVDTYHLSEVSQQSATEDRYAPESVREILRAEFPHLDLSAQVLDVSMRPFHSDSYSDSFVGHHLGAVIIKRVRFFRKQYDEMKYFMDEIRVLSRIPQHPNVETLLGYTWGLETEYPRLVLKYIGDENVSTYVKKNPNCNIVQMILGVAKGLVHIHDHDIVHADIKSSNILIDSHGRPTISNFNIPWAYENASTMASASVIERFRWTAIELLTNDNESFSAPTKATDMWAFGMTVYELLSGNIPYAHFTRHGHVLFAILKGQLPPCPSSSDNWSQSQKILWSICQDCWHEDPVTRPQMSALVVTLESLFNLQKYIG